MKVHIFGASGSGVTTLGNALADQIGLPYFDTDYFFGSPPTHHLPLNEIPLNGTINCIPN